MLRRRSIWFPAALGLTAAAPVSGEVGQISQLPVAARRTAPPAIQPAPLRPVDQAVADRHALSVSLREVEGGLRVPDDFSEVFPVPGYDDLFMRAAGSIHAVFPKSTYVPRRGVLVPLVPDNTVHYIGRPSASDIAAWHGTTARKRTSQGNPEAQGAATHLSQRVDTRVELRVDTQDEPNGSVTAWAQRARRTTAKRPVQPTVRRESSAAARRIAMDTGYRGRRLGALVRRAAAAARAQASSTPREANRRHHQRSQGS